MSVETTEHVEEIVLPVEPHIKYGWIHWNDLETSSGRGLWSVESACRSTTSYAAPGTGVDNVENQTVRLTRPLERLVRLGAGDPNLNQDSNMGMATVAVDLGYSYFVNHLHVRDNQFPHKADELVEWAGEVRQAEMWGEIPQDSVLKGFDLGHRHELTDPVGYRVDEGKYTNLEYIARFLRVERDELIRHLIALSLGKYYNQRVWDGELRDADVLSPYHDALREEYVGQMERYLGWQLGEWSPHPD